MLRGKVVAKARVGITGVAAASAGVAIKGVASAILLKRRTRSRERERTIEYDLRTRESEVKPGS